MNTAKLFKYNNPHPKGKRVGDCVKRAITLASGKDYMEVQRDLNKFKKITKSSVFNDPKNYKYYIENILNGKKITFQAEKGKSRMTGWLFAIDHPTGTYILRMAGHLSCCIDGQINDTWNCSHKCVYNVWEIK